MNDSSLVTKNYLVDMNVEKEKEICLSEMGRVNRILRARDSFSLDYDKESFEGLIRDIGDHYDSRESGVYDKYNGKSAQYLIEHKLATRLTNFAKDWDTYEYRDSYENDEMAFKSMLDSVRDSKSLKEIYKHLVESYIDNFNYEPFYLNKKLLDSIQDKGRTADKSKNIDIYVDGSFNAETGEYGYGVYILDTKRVLSGNGVARSGGRNIEGEVAGATRAINFALQQGYSEVTIFHDYEGIGRWGDKDWKRNKPYTETYSNLVEKARETLKITFVHVDGHTGVEGNEIVDVVSKKACGIELTPKQSKLYTSVVSPIEPSISNVPENDGMDKGEFWA